MPDLLLKKESPSERFKVERRDIALFYIALASLLITLAVYGGLFLVNRDQRDTKLGATAQVETKTQELDPQLIQQIFVIDQSLKNIQTLLVNHTFTSNVFRLVETNTHPQVRFLNFNLHNDSRKIDMSGEAASYAVLARQIALFEADPQVEQVEFGGLSLREKAALGFKMTLVFRSSLLQLRPAL